MKNEKLYTVVSDGTVLRCIDANTGTQFNTYRLNGTLVSGPVVTGDRVTIVVRRSNSNFGQVLKLPSFMLTSTFRG
jgi:outer membrane protein assembly factor BamB